MNNNNKNEQHLSAAELAGLPGMPTSERGVRLRATDQAWPSRPREKRRGGGREYPVSCLPPEAQAALASVSLSTISPLSPSAPPGSGESFSSASAASNSPSGAQISATPAAHRAESLAAMFDAKPEKLKAKARARLAVVQEYHQLLARGFNRDQVESAVISVCGISTATLWRLLDLVKGKPEHLWLHELCPAYAGRTALAAFSDAAWESFKADYLRAERPTLSSCYWRMKRAAPAHGWTVPSEKTVLRRVEREIPRAARVLAREGKKAALALYPSQVRSRAALSALSIINGDGYKHNVWTVFADGEIARAKTWFWQDVYSSKIIGWRTDKTEHTDVIRLSFGDVVEQYGIPEAAILDNTLAAANKTMSGGIRTRYRFRVRDDEPLGVFPLLGVEVKWATPGHGQAKPIERAFGIGGIGELVDKHPELAGAWTGGGTDDKPEYSEGKRGANKAVPIAQLEELIAREVAAWNAKQGRRSPMHRGRSFDEVFNESYARSTIRRASEAQRRLWLLATEPVTAGRRDGSITLDAGRISRTDVAPTQANRYWNDALVDYAGRQVVARFDPRQLHEGIHVYTLDGRWICYAACIAAEGFADQNAGREHQRARRTFVKGAKLQLQGAVRMGALEAAKFQPGAVKDAAEATIPAPKVVRPEFGSLIERPRIEPRALDASEQSFVAEAEAAVIEPRGPKVSELRSDSEKHTYWIAIDERRAAGDTLADQDEQFWKAWQSSSFFQLQRELDEEFTKKTATGG